LKQIATEENIPQPFLGKILQGLTHKGLVRSSKGLNGGFALAASPDKITLYSIVDAVDNVSLTESDCVLGRSICNEENPCPLHQFWKIQLANHLAFLHSVTLQQVCAENGNASLAQVDESKGSATNFVRKRRRERPVVQQVKWNSGGKNE